MLKKPLNLFLPHIKSLRLYANTAYSLRFEKFGEPLDVLELVERDLGEPCEDEVLVKVLTAPVNPSDVNTIQGKYAIKPELPAIPGNECVGEVVCIGKAVKSLNKGDRVVPLTSGLGTWTTMGMWKEQDLKSISTGIGCVEAATLTVNPCTAYRMLKDFVELNPGDTVIQNGANSAVGQAVHQLCRLWKINSVGVVRDRPDVEKLKEELKKLGATEVYTDQEIGAVKVFKENKLKKPTLALNCVGGDSATAIMRHLDNCGILVTYGGMSKKPVVVPTGPLIFKDLAFRGFWVTRWMKENRNGEEQNGMFTDLTGFMEKGEFKAPKHKLLSFEKYQEAAEAFCFTGFSGHKILFDMTTFQSPK